MQRMACTSEAALFRTVGAVRRPLGRRRLRGRSASGTRAECGPHRPAGELLGGMPTAWVRARAGWPMRRPETRERGGAAGRPGGLEPIGRARGTRSLAAASNRVVVSAAFRTSGNIPAQRRFGATPDLDDLTQREAARLGGEDAAKVVARSL